MDNSKTIEIRPPVNLGDPVTGDERPEFKWGDDALRTDVFAERPRPGQTVECSDGYAGRIVSIILDASRQLRGLVIRLGGPRQREVVVPAASILAFDQTTVHLGITREALRALPNRRTDAETAAGGHRALDAAGILRLANYDDVSITASDGSVTLRGHVGTATDRLRAEGALREVQGVWEVQNELVADDDLVNLVCQALALDERTRRETIFVAARHGVIVLSGLGNRAGTRWAAGECAVRAPNVRSVSNYIEVTGIRVDDAEQHSLPVRVGQEVFASDMAVGRVEQVIINPHNLRVAAMVVRGRFPDRKRANAKMRSYEMPMEERRMAIPAAEISFVTKAGVQLKAGGIAAAQRAEFAAGDFVQPAAGWQPPYPFATGECLWARP